MSLLKRIPGLLCTHRYYVVVLFFLVVLFGALLIAVITELLVNSVLCKRILAMTYAKRTCDSFSQNRAIGSLCAPLCITEEIIIEGCNSARSNKAIVFTAKWHDINMVFKKATSNVNAIHWYDNGKLKYPSETDFLNTVKAIVLNKLNLNITSQNAGKLAYLKPNYHESSTAKRQREMDDLWVLLQDNEYLLSSLYTERDIFPQLLGTCGNFYAVEELLPVQQGTNLFSINYEKKAWGGRLKTALLIIELLDELENGFHEHYHLCDIKLDHFGFTKTRTKIKFMDLIGVHTKSTANAMLQQIPTCASDNDCEYLDCRSRCNKGTQKCTHVTNNNLQIVCEKIFLGWRMSNRILVPGLLMASHTPAELATILRECSNPFMEMGKPRAAASEDVKKRLYNTLIEMEEDVNGDE